MARKTLIYFILISLSVPIFNGEIFAWDNDRTHKDLSQFAAKNSALEISKKNYLKNLGYNAGLSEKFKWNNKTQSVLLWLREGAFLEDAGTNWQALTGKARFNNHFHNPLKPAKDWNTAGVDDTITIRVPNPLPPYIPPFLTMVYSASGESALLWAQDKANQQSYSEDKGLEGDQTWQTIRNYFYKALTGETGLERQVYFSRVFKGLGHQMHLIQDMAVPAHVRNDAHPEDALFGKNYMTGDMYFETWAKNKSPIIHSFAATPLFPQVGFATISQFFDSDQYNENVVPNKSLTWGLSEYTNSNFVSDDTIFTENFSKNEGHYFPYPRYTDQSQCYEQFEQDIAPNKKRTYWRKKCVGEPINHFVVAEPLFKYLPSWALQRSTLRLDEASHRDYAEKFIPRAVGYSAALLDYFFRGDIRLSYETSGAPGYIMVNNTGEKMEGDFTIYYDSVKDMRFPVWVGKGTLEAAIGDKTNTFDFIPPRDAKEPGKYILVFKGKMGNEQNAVAGYVFQRALEITPPNQYVYSMIEGTGNPLQFTQIKAKVRNATSEEIQSGVFYAIAKYKTSTTQEYFSYSVSASRTISSLSAASAAEFTFDFSGNPIPVSISDLSLQIIFKGRISGEENAVAIGIKDISEPTPIDLFNNMDKVCLYGYWHNAGSPEAIAQVDTNHNGIAEEADVYSHDVRDIYIKIAPAGTSEIATTSDYQYTFPSLTAGNFKRALYILTDYTFNYSFLNKWGPSEPQDTNEPFTHYDESFLFSGTAVKNQTELISDSLVCGTEPPCYISPYPVFYHLRGIDMWWGGGLIYVNNPYPDDSECAWENLE